VIPVTRLKLQSGLSYEDMHARLESLFDTDDRIIADYAPGLPPRRPFTGSARLGKVRLVERIQRGNRRRATMLVASGRVEPLPVGCQLVLWFRPPAFTLAVLILSLLWTSLSTLGVGATGSPGIAFWTFAFVYLAVGIEFWWREQRAERVLRRAFNA
jgi:hypothetical protein